MWYFAKYSTPVVANGKVYVGTFSNTGCPVRSLRGLQVRLVLDLCAGNGRKRKGNRYDRSVWPYDN